MIKGDPECKTIQRVLEPLRGSLVFFFFVKHDLPLKDSDVVFNGTVKR